ncbi:MAG: phosphotransferase [Candidatus Heimdallarchaeota archaeon]|nr:phosphotransferase [Candidatus Heimdallarchaeota archaeon]MCG3257462.1 phosphotransferase [Candidatus Heimdallarchaeota archaeon]MCK4612515.1 phosphotransferase [Candidatus Heimdallarchaeota archaeon]
MPLSTLRISENLAKYLHNNFPENMNPEVLDVVPLAKGWETELFSFIYSYTKEGKKEEKKLILRMYPGENMERKISWEYKVLKTLYNAEYPVPKTYLLDLDIDIFGNPFIIMDRIEGTDMGEDFTNALMKNDQNKIVNEILPILSKLFVNLHSLDWRILSVDINNKDTKNPYFFIDKKIANLEKAISSYNIRELRPILEWVKEGRDKVKTERISILHGDFHPHNVIISKAGEPYVIDWPGCSIGDFRQDLGLTLMLVVAYTSREIRDEILRQYQNEIGFEIKNIEFFEVMATLSRFSEIFIALKYNFKEFGWREEAIEQIKETIFHLENLNSYVQSITKLSIPELKESIQSLLIT